METEVLFQDKSGFTTLSRYPIEPKHINTEQHFHEAFSNMEKEQAAFKIVRFCQVREGWFSFTLEDMKTFCYGDFSFNGLDHADPRLEFIIKRGGRYSVTHDFITQCFRSSPAIGQF